MSEKQIIANRFEIVAAIGQGGMGDVYRGLDTQTGETVAIKLLKPDIIASSPNLIERFEREGEALRQLDHPHIVKILATVEEDGLHYLIMEYVAGGSLRDLLEEEPQLPISRVMEIALDLADALTRAHRLKIIHRDIKPANVLLAEDGTPRLTDFGVARIGGRTRMTETGSLIGTYSYLSPEACMGEDLDGRTDIWSLGIMLYEMLTGRRPFESEQPTAILIGILNDPLPDLTEFRPDTPPALVHLINRMLVKDREQRIPSVRQVGAELEAILYGLETPLIASSPLAGRMVAPDLSRFATPSESGAQPPIPSPTLSGPAATSPTGQTLPEGRATQPIAPGWRKVWRALGGITAALLIVAILAVALGLFGAGDEDAGDADITARESVAQVEPVEPGEYMVLVAQLEPLGGVAEREVTRFIVEDLVETLEKEVPFSTIRIRAYPQVITSENEARAAAEVNDATVIVWGNYTPDFIELKVQVGVTTAFNYTEIPPETLDRTANLRARMAGERQESIAAPVLNVLSMLFTADGDAYEVARLIAILAEIDVVSPEVVGGGAGTHLYRGVLPFLDDPSSAIEEFNTAIASDPGNPISYAYRGMAYMRLGSHDEAWRDMETAQRLGPAEWTIPLFIRGIYEFTSGEVEKSIVTFDQIVAARPDDWFPVNFRAAVYYLMGEYDLAKAGHARAIELGPDANFPYILSAMLALREGNISEAQAYLQTVLTEFPDPNFSNRIIQATFGSEVPNIFGPLFAAAGHLILGQYEDVIRDAEEALAIDDQIADVYLMQGLAYCNLDDYETAEAAYSQAIELDPDFTALYLLRAEVRRELDDPAGSLADLQTAQQHELGREFDALIQAGMSGEIGCKNFFSYQLPEQEDADNQQ